ncbi:MAG: hypothetical protein KAX11_03950, partial [Candidatus Aminicenantes bacterium]|nr:hypothetical protein [Candidatus Aminicenantes bacterium]
MLKKNNRNPKPRFRSVAFFCFLAAALLFSLNAQEQDKQEKEQEKKELQVMPRIELKNLLMPGHLHEISVPSYVFWTDTGFDVLEGQEIRFITDPNRKISLQSGNPVAWCGPDGKNLKTIQQPIKGKNFGALIGRVVRLVSIEIDEESEEEIRNELIRYFYIGSKN